MMATHFLTARYSSKVSSSFTKNKLRVPSNLRSLADRNTASLLPKLKKTQEKEREIQIPLFETMDTGAPRIEPELFDSIILDLSVITPKPDPSLIQYNELPQLSDCSKDEFDEILTKKLEICSQSFDFLSPKYQKYIEIKTNALLELISTLDSNLCFVWTNEEYIRKFNKMIFKNLNRTIYLKKEVLATLGEKTSFVDNCWIHLQLIYDFLIRYVRTFGKESKLSSKLILRIVSSLASPDKQERDKILNFLVLYVSVFKESLNQIYRHMFFLIAQYIEDQSLVFCVAPCLTFLTRYADSIERAFSRNYNEVLVNILSLVSMPHLRFFASELLGFIDVILRKRKKILRAIILKLLRRFPVSNLAHQTIIITMINALLPKISAIQFKSIAHVLFKLYGECANSVSIKVAEASLQIWEINEIQQFIADSSKVIFPLVYTNILKALHGMNALKIRPTALTVLQKMQTINPEVFNKLSSIKEFSVPINQSAWNTVFQMANTNYKNQFALPQFEEEITEASRFPSVAYQ